MKNTLLAVFLISSLGVCGQAVNTTSGAATDTIKKDRVKPHDTVQYIHNNAWSYVPPAVFVAYGGLSFVVGPIRHVDYYIKDRIQQSAPKYNSKIDDYLQIAPGAMVYLLNLAGDEGKNRFVDRTAMLALSGLILTGTDGLKYVMHRQRPFGGDYLSFPSGHTGAAFVAAEFLAEEYGDKSVWYSVGGYACATATAVMRLYNRAHWFSDCVAGAGFGILSVRAAYWLYPHIRNALTHKDKHGRSTMIMPSYSDGAPGLLFAMQL
ncbi:MAG: phosphatase PAP2 family protein [Bacteroidetes bacterium]|nr:phosphatase PAP2 family protein [Bacteroidota bacterium]